MPFYQRSKTEDKITEGLGTRELRHIVRPKQLVHFCWKKKQWNASGNILGENTLSKNKRILV
jgi:hypothetical protein